MPFVPAKCTNCGGHLTVDESKEAGICPHCQQPYIMEKAINYYNTTNVTNIDTINAEVVNVESSDSADNLYKAGQTNLDFRDFDKASDIFQKMTDTYPQDYRGWYGLILAKTLNLQGEILNAPYLEYVKSLIKKLSYLQKDSAHVDFASINNYISAQADGVQKKEKENAAKSLAKEYKIQPIEKKNQAQKRCKIIKRISLIAVSAVFVLIAVLLVSYGVELNLEENPFIYEGQWRPEEHLFEGMVSNGCIASSAIFFANYGFRLFWMMAMSVLFVLGTVCCFVGKTPITETFDLSKSRKFPSIFKITPIRSVLCIFLLLVLVISLYCCILASKIKFPSDGIYLYGFGDEATTVSNAVDYVATHLFYSGAIGIMYSCVGMLPFLVYFFIERKQAKRQLEFELKLIKYVI